MAKRRLNKKEKYITERVSERTGIHTFRFDYRYTDIAGNQDREIKVFSEKDYGSVEMAKRACVQYRDQFLFLHDSTGIPVKTSITVNQLFEKKFELFPRSYKTKKQQIINFNQYIKPKYGSYDIKDISAKDIQLTLNILVNDKSDNLISKVLSIWKGLYRTAIFLDLVTIDQTIKVIRPKSKASRKSRNVLSNVPSIEYVYEKIRDNSSQSDLSYYNGEILIYIIKVMYHSGIRPAECFAICRDDVDFKNKILYLNFAIGSNENERAVLIPTKTEKSVRSIPMSDDLIDIFKEVFAFTDNYYLFQDWDGNFMEIDNVATKIARIFKNDQYHFNLYNLRHQFATDLTLNNVDPRTIQELMGHTTATMTLSYARSNKDKEREAIEKRLLN